MSPEFTNTGPSRLERCILKLFGFAKNVPVVIPLPLLITLEMADVETPNWRATSANESPKSSANWCATLDLT